MPDDPLDRARRDPETQAVIAIMRGASDGLALRNAHCLHPWGNPVLQVGSQHASALLAAVEARQPARLETDARWVEAKAANVIAHLDREQDAEAPAVVLLTPRSGWWHCAAERGGGIACWLGVLNDLADNPTLPPVRFLATSGHELACAGLRTYLGENPSMGTVWVHLGANLGAAGGRLGVIASDRSLAERATSILKEKGGFTTSEFRSLERPAGEAIELARAGLPFVSLVATNRRFHLRSDRFPDNVDTDRLVGLVESVILLVRSLAVTT